MSASALIGETVFTRNEFNLYCIFIQSLVGSSCDHKTSVFFHRCINLIYALTLRKKLRGY